MIFQGKAVTCVLEDAQIAHLKFNLVGDSVNKFNALTLKELGECIDIVRNTKDLRGLLMSSEKDCFIVGADVTEFLSHFKRSKEEMEGWISQANKLFSSIEDLPFPTVVAINGFALGGGFEVCLTTSYRIATKNASVGFPESKLGIIPGWGGTVRFSRLTGPDYAIEWITSGNQYSAEEAFKLGAVDAIVEPGKLIECCKKILERANSGELDWKARRENKTSPIKMADVEMMMAFETAKGYVRGIAGPNYPAPVKAVEVMQKGAKLARDEALAIETKAFVELARSETAEALVHVFLGQQLLKKFGKDQARSAKEVKKAAVLGAGIMGGGVCYQSATSGIPVIMKDINEKALMLGMEEATNLLNKQLERKKIDAAGMAKTIALVSPTLNYDKSFQDTTLVVEAVVENEGVKQKVLAELEDVVSPSTIVTSNTSTISITSLAKNLKRPENFCGMHFFNPVHRMPLVEVIRGEKSSDAAIATTVAYALKMGKTPIVVNDCAGFLVNRVLLPYLSGLAKLISDGADFQKVDKVMEEFGWPMGPAYLIDVVGIDTGHHAMEIMAKAFPRMRESKKTAIDVLYGEQRLGQKNNKGFYLYTKDKKGRPKKEVDTQVYALLEPLSAAKKDFPNEEIVERMMLPMIFECVRCLEDKIVKTVQEVDMGLVFGIGFPPFRAGALKYADKIGLSKLVELASKYQGLGELYQAPKMLVDMAKAGQKFYNDLKS